MKKYIDATPTWEAVLPIFIAVLSNPDASPTARSAAEEELRRMAMLADELVAQVKARKAKEAHQ